MILKAGAFDRHDGMRIELNLWAQSRPAWAPIDDTLPRFAKLPPMLS